MFQLNSAKLYIPKHLVGEVTTYTKTQKEMALWEQVYQPNEEGLYETN